MVYTILGATEAWEVCDCSAPEKGQLVTPGMRTSSGSELNKAARERKGVIKPALFVPAYGAWQFG